MANFVVKICLLAILSSMAVQIDCSGSSTTESLPEAKAAEANANYVLVHFMDKKRDEFMQILPDIKSAIANSVSAFCADEAPRCGSDIS
jgi:hypothetical protein